MYRVKSGNPAFRAKILSFSYSVCLSLTSSIEQKLLCLKGVLKWDRKGVVVVRTAKVLKTEFQCKHSFESAVRTSSQIKICSNFERPVFQTFLLSISTFAELLLSSLADSIKFSFLTLQGKQKLRRTVSD
jgi:hypothetical protein